ncbi:MAG TPA: ABC transporter permease [Anaerolineales bacterium]|nr:ABC transporter permease [Anaerolineales bacterium]
MRRERILTFEYDTDAVQTPAIQELRELWQYRDLLQLLVANSIKTRYKRSALGVLWTLLNPLLTTIVLTIAFSQLFRFKMENYPVYLLSGLIAWNFFSQTLTQIMNTVIWGSNLVKRIYVPRTIFAISVVGNGLVNLTLALVPLFVIMAFMGQPWSWTLLLLPLATVVLAMFTTGLSLLLATFAVYFVDLVEMIKILLMAWFYLTPIIYPLEAVPPHYAWLIRLNPMSYMIEIFRGLIYNGTLPNLTHALMAVMVAVLTLLLGWIVFTRKANEFAYRI